MEPLLVAVLVAVFVAMGIWPSWAVRLRLHGRVGMLAAGTISGILGPLVGATGILVAPFFLRDDWRKEQIVATMAFAQMCGHALKIAAFSANGFNVFARLDLLIPMLIAAIMGAVIGRQLVGLFSETRFRQLFRLILMVLSLKLGWDGLSGLLGF